MNPEFSSIGVHRSGLSIIRLPRESKPIGLVIVFFDRFLGRRDATRRIRQVASLLALLEILFVRVPDGFDLGTVVRVMSETYPSTVHPASRSTTSPSRSFCG